MKVLVLGDGLLGSEIVKQTGWNYISRKKDGFDFDCLFDKSLFDGYDTIINCIANTDTYTWYADNVMQTNYKSVVRLADICNEVNIKLVHISTDYVYAESPDLAPTEEDVPTHSPNWYTYSKLLADEYIKLKSNNFLICRCTHIPRPFPYPNGFVDRFGNFDYVDTIASLIIALIRADAIGVYNVGTHSKSMYDLAKETRDDVQQLPTPAYMPKKTQMSVQKMRKTLGLI